MSVILGVVIILAVDVSSYATGMLLAYGGGVYVHIGAGECMSRVYPVMNNLSLRFAWLVSFVVGAAAIGLVLLDHEHCSADGGPRPRALRRATSDTWRCRKEAHVGAEF